MITLADDASTEHLLRQWIESQWLQVSDATGFYELGPRSHLELRPLIEAAITSQADEDQNVEGALGGGLLQQSLPQIIYY